MTANSKRLVGRIAVIVGVMAICLYVIDVDLLLGLAALIAIDGRRSTGFL